MKLPLKEDYWHVVSLAQDRFEVDWYLLVTVPNFSTNKKIYYTCVSLSFNRIKSTTLTPNINAETVKNAKKNCKNVS